MRRYKRIRRQERDRCWCGGSLGPFPWHESYGVCAECGCYVNKRPPLAEELEKVYAFDLYWHKRQQMKGFPPIEGRTKNDLGDGRVDYWLDLVKRYGPKQGSVIEVGCAHGVLLSLLQRQGYECIGVEPDERTAQWTRQKTGLDVRAGIFPACELPPCDLFLAFDVIEHSLDPEAFLKGAADLLRHGGIGILQCPINRYDFQPPLGNMFPIAFDEIEHIHIFTDRAMEELAGRAGLRILDLSERLWLGHEVCVLRKPALGEVQQSLA
ncbi:MAG: class I SAM-dependent methyltransferase [Candidatus Tectomicrobia bacterium]|nr:class I SAM-dependent methyltransferase [Candidatus Tectomicrobia bacterium]